MAKQKRSLGSSEDVQAARAAATRSNSAAYLKIPNTRTPWFLLSLDFVAGYTHFVPMGNGLKEPMTCAGDPDDRHGFDPENCPICRLMLKRYQKAKQLGGKAGELLKKETNEMRASFQAKFVAVRGDKAIAIDKATGKKVYVANFDVVDDGDEESEVEVGILALSESQYIGLTDMVEDADVPWVKDYKDLANRVLWTRKVKGKGRYRKVEWSASKKRQDTPQVEIPDGINFDEEFEVDLEKLERAVAVLEGKIAPDAVEDDEEVAVESDDEESKDESSEEDTEEDEIDEVEQNIEEDSEDIEEDYFDGDEGEESGDSDDDEPEGDYLIDVGEDEPDDDIHPEEFEDDIPDEPEPKPARKPTAKRPTVTKSPSKRPGSSKPTAKKPVNRSAKSGKAKL